MSTEQTNHDIPDADVVDFSYVMDLAGDKPDFMYQVLTIFMENTPQGLKELEEHIRHGDAWEKISKQAHYLKSSVSIVRIKGMHERLQQIEMLAKEKRGKDEIIKLLNEMLDTFKQAEKIINEKIASVS